MRSKSERGISLVELLMALVVVVIIAAIAIPNISHMEHTSRMRGAAADFTTLIESQRLYAIRDNRFYSVYLLTSPNAPSQAFIDMFPQSTTASSGNGGTAVVAGTPGLTGDPVFEIPAEVTQQAVTNAPDTTSLQNLLLPSNTAVTPTDASTTPFTIGPRGLPCTPLAVTGGSVCDSSGGPVAYWTFFTDSSSGEWDAVTITPAGKIGKWYHTGSVWKSF
jgi:Tfp pilus assembly protein FimT